MTIDLDLFAVYRMDLPAPVACLACDVRDGELTEYDIGEAVWMLANNDDNSGRIAPADRRLLSDLLGRSIG